MENKLMPTNAIFSCEICNFKCSKNSNYEIHCQTKKHIIRLNGNKMENAENIGTKKNATPIFKDNFSVIHIYNKMK
jgi:hypothetical protein